MERMLTNILTDDIKSTRHALTNLLDFSVEFETDWFINMTKGTNRYAIWSTENAGKGQEWSYI